MTVRNATIALALAGIAFALVGAASIGAGEEKMEFTLRPVGWVRKADDKTFVEIEEKYQDALLGLDGFSHVHVIWWFHKNDVPEKRAVLRVHPRAKPDNPLTGVFATRSPVRPNLLALSLCKILSVEGRRVYIENIDAFDGTPVVDLKPYLPGDRIPDARFPDWVSRKDGSTPPPAAPVNGG